MNNNIHPLLRRDRPWLNGDPIVRVGDRPIGHLLEPALIRPPTLRRRTRGSIREKKRQKELCSPVELGRYYC
jgi:hypothetical protein